MSISKDTSPRVLLNRREEVYVRLKRAILGYEVHPGQVLSANALSQELNVSRTPVREALQLLEKDGLVRRLGARGVEIVGTSMAEVEDVFSVRELLERRAARLAATSLDGAKQRHLVEAVGQMERASTRGDAVGWADADERIHSLLWEAAGSPFMQEVLALARQRTQRVAIHDATRPDRIQISTQEHRAIVDAVASRDPDAAEAAVASHLMALRKRTLALFNNTLLHRIVI